MTDPAQHRPCQLEGRDSALSTADRGTDLRLIPNALSPRFRAHRTALRGQAGLQTSLLSRIWGTWGRFFPGRKWTCRSHMD